MLALLRIRVLDSVGEGEGGMICTKRVVYSEHYRLEDGIELLKRAGIEVLYVDMEQERESK